MKKKATYLIHNWSYYNASLKKRESGAICVSSQAVENWTTDELTGQPGALRFIPNWPLRLRPQSRSFADWLAGRLKASSNRFFN